MGETETKIEGYAVAEASKLIRKYANAIQKELAHNHVEIESVAKDGRTSSLMTNIVYTNRLRMGEVYPFVQVDLRWRKPFQIAYARQLPAKKGEFSVATRKLAEMVGVVHNCAKRIGKNGLQAMVDYEGLVSGSRPALSFGGDFRDEDFDDVLRLLVMTNTMMDLSLMEAKRE